MCEPVCPRCQSRNIAEILWGMPAFTDELQTALRRHEVVLGGCCIEPPVPAWQCQDCLFTFGGDSDAPARGKTDEPFSTCTEVVAAERVEIADTVDFVRFSHSQWVGGPNRTFWLSLAFDTLSDRDEVDFTRLGGDHAHITQCPFEDKEFENPCDLKEAFGALHTELWTEGFRPDDPILDGFTWDLEVYSGMRFYCCDGSNVMPASLDSFLALVEHCGLPAFWTS